MTNSMLISKQYRTFKHSRLPPAIVLGINPNGNDMEYCLARQKINTYMLDFACGPTHVQKQSLDSLASQLLAWLNDFIRDNSSVAIFASSDRFSLLLAMIRPNLDSRFKFLLPDISLIEQCVDKFRFFNLCHTVGIPTPNTHIIEKPSDTDKLDAIFFPCVVKPYDNKKIPNKILNKIRIVYSNSELSQLAERILRYDDKFIAQKLIEGGSQDRYFVGGLVTPNQHDDALFIGRKLRETPIVGGTTTQCKLEWNDAVYRHFQEFVAKTGYVGFIDFEMMHDKSDNQFKLIEINPRIGAWHLVSKTGKQDIIYYHYLLLNGFPVENYSPQKEGKTFLRLHAHYCSLVDEYGFFRSVATIARDLRKASVITGINLSTPNLAYRYFRIMLGCTINSLLGRKKSS